MPSQSLTCIALQGHQHTLRKHRRMTKTNAREFGNRAADRGCDERRRHLAYAGRLAVGRYDSNLDVWQIPHPHHGMVVEVRLLDLAVLDGDLRGESHTHSVDDASFRLCHDIVRLNGDTRVDRNP